MGIYAWAGLGMVAACNLMYLLNSVRATEVAKVAIPS